MGTLGHGDSLRVAGLFEESGDDRDQCHEEHHPFQGFGFDFDGEAHAVVRADHVADGKHEAGRPVHLAAPDEDGERDQGEEEGADEFEGAGADDVVAQAAGDGGNQHEADACLDEAAVNAAEPEPEPGTPTRLFDGKRYGAGRRHDD